MAPVSYVLLLGLAFSEASAAAQPNDVDTEVEALLIKMDDPALWDASMDRIEALGERAVPAVTAALDDQLLQHNALVACLRLGEKMAKALPKLIEMVRDEHHPSREVAIHVLSALGAEADLAAPYLLDALRDDSSRIRAAAAGSFRRIGPANEAVLSELQRLLDDADANTRLEAAYALATVGAGPRERIVEILLNAASSRDGSARRTALSAIQRVEPPVKEATPIVLAALRDGSFETSIHAAATLVIINRDRAGKVRAILAAGLQHHDPYYRMRSALALGNLGPASRIVRPNLEALLDDSSPLVREAVTRALERVDGSVHSYDLSWTDAQLFAIFELDGELAAGVVDPYGVSVIVKSGERFLDAVIEQVGPYGLFMREETVDREYELLDIPSYLPLEPDNAELPGGEQRDSERMSVYMDGDDFADLLYVVAEMTGLNIVVQPDVKREISIAVRDISWDALVERVLAENGLAYAFENNFVRICRSGVPPAAARYTEFDGDLLSLAFKDAVLSDIVPEIWNNIGFEITGALPKDLSVTIYAKEVPWDQALEHMLRGHGWTYDRRGSTLHLRPIASTPFPAPESKGPLDGSLTPAASRRSETALCALPTLRGSWANLL